MEETLSRKLLCRLVVPCLACRGNGVGSVVQLPAAVSGLEGVHAPLKSNRSRIGHDCDADTVIRARRGAALLAFDAHLWSAVATGGRSRSDLRRRPPPAALSRTRIRALLARLPLGAAAMRRAPLARLPLGAAAVRCERRVRAVARPREASDALAAPWPLRAAGAQRGASHVCELAAAVLAADAARRVDRPVRGRR
ncbi:hypothetical protein PRIPAC_91945 [Pristionchus pacificus]|uniref:Uncharacterized protein n=1 Tax=Pristionchus pacificus TaxID=54126 RepID=A0A2A6CH93_PRIPA|nr:hypothetical protein PRIPAC_91945 [Pristionchus pacificus]|eukprot:PDM77572.1 hypothetical protein PRIPAC_34439 [Pristionchus pacificus]